MFFEDSVLKLLGKTTCSSSGLSPLMCIKARNVALGSGVPRLKPVSTNLTRLLRTWKIEGKLVSRAPVHLMIGPRISMLLSEDRDSLS